MQLGVGFSLAESLRSDRLEHVTVVEIEPKIVEWNQTYLAPYSGDALSDPRVQVIIEDVVVLARKKQCLADTLEHAVGCSGRQT